MIDEKKLWLFAQKKLAEGQPVAFMLVPQSRGSSPGRQGHQMMVARDAAMLGTIGGGVMEYQQVEACKKALWEEKKAISWKQLIHSQTNREKWSGLSCSGEQIVLTFFLEVKDKDWVTKLLRLLEEEVSYTIVADAKTGLSLEKTKAHSSRFNYVFKTEKDWSYSYQLGFQETVYLIGAGHVGLALCQQLSLLNFKIVLIDNRANLPTEEYDQFISKKIITSYKKVATFVPSTSADYIVIMSFSSALDTLILGQLMDKPARYIGMMASQTKVKRVQATLLKQGHAETAFKRVHTPIGLPIKCKTPAEIAVSVAAQMIEIRNALL